MFVQDNIGNVLMKDQRVTEAPCSSYDGECVVMMEAHEWIIKGEREDLKYGIYTNSMSLIIRSERKETMRREENRKRQRKRCHPAPEDCTPD